MAAELMQLTDTQRASFIMFATEKKDLVGDLSSFVRLSVMALAKFLVKSCGFLSFFSLFLVPYKSSDIG